MCVVFRVDLEQVSCGVERRGAKTCKTEKKSKSVRGFYFCRYGVIVSLQSKRCLRQVVK